MTRLTDQQVEDAAIANVLRGLRRNGHDDPVLDDLTPAQRREVDRAVLRDNDRRDWEEGR